MLGFSITTGQREEMVDITANAEAMIRHASSEEGALMLFCPHTTCGLTINESADPDVRHDIMRFFGEIAPHIHGWKHMEGNSDAHIRASLLGSSVLLPISHGQIQLGRWQAIYLYEGDGPRKRSVWGQILKC